MSESLGGRGYIEILEAKELSLANLLESKYRSRFQNITEMDASSVFLFGLEKTSGPQKVIHTLLSDAGQELLEPGQIRRRAVDFIYACLLCVDYKFLWTGRPPGPDVLCARQVRGRQRLPDSGCFGGLQLVG